MHISIPLPVNYKTLLFFILLLLVSFSAIAQKKTIPKDFCIDNIEQDLYTLINQLRADYDKSELQLSASLSYVANLHVNDLQNNNPDTSICNLSSWSDKGNWTPCCYTKYLHNPDCMWDKPKELTPFTYRGYELVTFFQNDFNTDTIINLLSNSKEALDMILTQGYYKKKIWICAGIGISENYVSIWFAQRKDKLREPNICVVENKKNNTKLKNSTTSDTIMYYLISGSFDSMQDAKRACKEVKKDNFVNCEILEMNNKFRVSLNKYGSMKEAMTAQKQLPTPYKEAWILKD